MTQTEKALKLIAAERERQIKQEKYSRAHDDKHDEGELSDAAASIARMAGLGYVPETAEMGWPWSPDYLRRFVGKSALRLLVIAGALIVAEIERRMRAGEKP